MATQSVELILARNIVSAITLASFLVDPDGKLVFFNDAAGELVGQRFEEVGRLRQEDWASEFGPFDEFGEELVEVDVSALPLTTADGFKGAIVVFWRTESGDPA